MKMKEGFIGLYRGCLLVGYHYAKGPMDWTHKEEYGHAYAVTQWHRHDDNENTVEKELEALSSVYRKDRNSDAMSMWLEYKEYNA